MFPSNVIIIDTPVKYNLETTKENKTQSSTPSICSLQKDIEQNFFDSLNKLFNQILHQSQYQYSNKLFFIKQNNISTESPSFIEISNMHLKLIGSLPFHERQYACIGMFTFMNDIIPKINKTRYYTFLNILLEKIREPEFVNAVLLEDIRVKLEKTIVKKLTSTKNLKKSYNNQDQNFYFILHFNFIKFFNEIITRFIFNSTSIFFFIFKIWSYICCF